MNSCVALLELQTGNDPLKRNMAFPTGNYWPVGHATFLSYKREILTPTKGDL